MCGIAGFVDPRGNLDIGILRDMSGSLAHRGPDADGHALIREEAFVLGLGHRRLSILDLSTGANQPFVSECGRYHLIYNGEIYNFAEIRRELEALGHAFRTHGDTEVLLHGLMEWGKAAVHKCNGMFAFAFYDAPRRELLLCRDRAGVKPLNY
jgi:asparagine synthase (glutamine-hydrolysing)